MWFLNDAPVRHRGFVVLWLAIGLAWAPPGARGVTAPAPAPELASASSPAALPVVKDTPSNLQEAFDNEVNARERYRVFAETARVEGYAAVASLFRACAAAEQVHADRHVHAIAWCGGEARARLQRIQAGTTAENLRAALDFETWESTQLYPAMMAQARADRMPEAVRSMNYALGAERDHAQLLATALATLEARPAAPTYYVCPGCGHTVESVPSGKCAHCFAGANRFMAVK